MGTTSRAEYQKGYRRRNPEYAKRDRDRAKARNMAMAQLRYNHKAEYEALYEDALKLIDDEEVNE